MPPESIFDNFNFPTLIVGMLIGMLINHLWWNDDDDAL